jgi:hypothetical protein
MTFLTGCSMAAIMPARPAAATGQHRRRMDGNANGILWQ